MEQIFENTSWSIRQCSPECKEWTRNRTSSGRIRIQTVATAEDNRIKGWRDHCQRLSTLYRKLIVRKFVKIGDNDRVQQSKSEKNRNIRTTLDGTRWPHAIYRTLPSRNVTRTYVRLTPTFGENNFLKKKKPHQKNPRKHRRWRSLRYDVPVWSRDDGTSINITGSRCRITQSDLRLLSSLFSPLLRSFFLDRREHHSCMYVQFAGSGVCPSDSR